MNYPFLLLSADVLFIAVILVVDPVAGQANCPNGEDYRPCTCRQDAQGYSVRCDGVSPGVVSYVFQQTTPTSWYMFELLLTSMDSNKTTPADLIGNHNVSQISLYSPSFGATFLLRIHPDAFRSTKDYAQKLYLSSCDLTPLDFNFLSGFHNLYNFQLNAVSNMHLADWASMPPLPNLTDLAIAASEDLNSWTVFPTLVRGLKRLELITSDVLDMPMNAILDWVVQHSAEILEKLNLYNNYLTVVPRQLSSLTSLRDLSIDLQLSDLPMISAGDIRFSSPVTQLSIGFTGLETIESGAFQGDFRNAFVDFNDNKLTRFDELVFKEMLQQMATSSGRLYANQNPFDCGGNICHLAWLIRDNPNLLSPLSAFCSNRTWFSDLDPNGFSQCA